MRWPARLVFHILVLSALVGAVLTTVSSPAAAVSHALWRVDCAYVKSTMDDPIAFPNQPGASHLHDFFGNVAINAYSTYTMLQTMDSTCTGNDHSGYWAPALYRGSIQITPSAFVAYYENTAETDVTIEPFPPGFKATLGDPHASRASQLDSHIAWGCSDGTGFGAHEPPPACASGAIRLALQWPNCWNGRTSHGVATGHLVFPSDGACPANHPHALPALRTDIVYPVGTTTGDISIASGSIYSVHADFFNGWNQTTMADLVSSCLNREQNCPVPGDVGTTETSGAAGGAGAGSGADSSTADSMVAKQLPAEGGDGGPASTGPSHQASPPNDGGLTATGSERAAGPTRSARDVTLTTVADGKPAALRILLAGLTILFLLTAVVLALRGQRPRRSR